MSRKPRFTNLPPVLMWNGELVAFEEGWQLYEEGQVRFKGCVVLHKRALCIGRDEEGKERRFMGRVIGKVRNDWLSRIAFLIQHEWTKKIEFAHKIFPVGEKEIPHEDLCCRVDHLGRSVRPVLLQSSATADCPGASVCNRPPEDGTDEAAPVPGRKKAAAKVHLLRRAQTMSL